MKKLFLFAFFIMATLTAAAQKGEFSLGAGFSYGFTEKEFGVGLKAQYGFAQRCRGELAANYLPGVEAMACGDSSSDWELNLNAHYLFPLKKGWTFYPLAGAVCRISNTVFKPTHALGTYSYWGANLGAGIEKNLGKHWKINAELKGQMMKYYGQVVLGVGVAYRF